MTTRKSMEEGAAIDIRDIHDRILTYDDGEVIFEEGSIGNEMYIIESGEAKISQRIRGRETTIIVLGEGDFFGEMAVFDDAPRSATAVAIGRATLISFSLEEILQRMQTNVRFATVLLQTLIKRLRSTTARLSNLIARTYELVDEFANDTSASGN